MDEEPDASAISDAPPNEPSVTDATPVAVTIPMAIVLVIAVVFAVLQWQRANDLAHDKDRQSAAAAVASDFVTELLGYDHRDLVSHEERVAATATERFLTEYQRALDGGLRDNIVALEAVAAVTVRDVFVGDASGDRVEVVIVADTEAVSRTGTRRLVGAYLQVALQWDDGAGMWLVDEVTTVATLDEVLEPPAGESPSGPSSPLPPSPTSTPSPTPESSPTAAS